MFTKGAPEMIAHLCQPESVPANFKSVLKSYTLQGYRVLALGCKTLKRRQNWWEIQKMSREAIETDIELLGLLVMHNALKKDTLRSIRILHEARLSSVMVTGDNLQTAITVARQCEIISKEKRIIQVEAKWVTASVNAVAHLQVVFVDPLATPEFLGDTVHGSFLICYYLMYTCAL